MTGKTIYADGPNDHATGAVPVRLPLVDYQQAVPLRTTSTFRTPDPQLVGSYATGARRHATLAQKPHDCPLPAKDNHKEGDLT